MKNYNILLLLINILIIQVINKQRCLHIYTFSISRLDEEEIFMISKYTVLGTIIGTQEISLHNLEYFKRKWIQ